MARPILRMTKSDVETAICSKFRRDAATLNYSKSQKFSGVTIPGTCSFTIQDEFHGEGRYRVVGRASLWNVERNFSEDYDLETYVEVVSVEGTPKINFSDQISARPFLRS